MVRNIGILLATTALVSVRLPKTNDGGFDFPETVDDITTVPERARGLYTEKDGKFVYTDIGGLRNGLTNARQERDDAKRQAAAAAAYKALGKTPEEIKALLDAAAAAEEARLTEAGDFRTLREQMEANHANALSEKDKRVDKYKSALEKTMIDSQLHLVLAAPDVEGNPLFLLPALRGRVRLEESDDGFTPVVLREDGSPLLNAQNQPATIKDLVLDFRGQEQWAGAFKGLNQSGGGAHGGSGGGGGAGSMKKSEMSSMQKVAYIQQHGQKGYDALPK